MGNSSTKQSGKWGDGVNLDWTEEGVKALRAEVLKTQCSEEIILMVFGSSGSGKSSLLNGFRSALQCESRVSRYFQVGANIAKDSLTRDCVPALYCYKTCKRGCTDQCEPFLWTIDTPGTFTGKPIEDIMKYAAGEISPSKEVNDKLPSPPTKRKASCVIVVMRCGQEVMKDMKMHLKELLKLSGQGVLSVFLILTHPDGVDPSLEHPDGLPYIFKSPRVRQAVAFAAENTNIKENCIGVVRNYTRELYTDTNTNILLLHALSNIMHAAKDNQLRSESFDMFKK